MQTVTVGWLQTIDSLSMVPVTQLQWFIDSSTHYILNESDFLFVPGNQLNGTHIIVSGSLRLYLEQGTGTREITLFEAKNISGYLPFSRGDVAFAHGQATETTQVMTFPREKMMELIGNHFELTQALVHVMTTRVRDYTALQQQNEKMMALGKLSAGLAHELNNPAAAIVRSSVSLRKHLKLLPENFKSVIAIQMTETQVDVVNELLFSVLAKSEMPVLSMVQRSQKEDEMMDWLDGRTVNCAADVAENFVDFGFSLHDVNEFAAQIPPAYLSPVLEWINSNLVTEKMVTDIQDASQRISDLVKSVKNFTRMDRGTDKVYSDIHAGIHNTLNMLAHKIKKGNITVEEQFNTALPPVKALVGELNQVWTNIIDNAIDAMEINRKGKLIIKTEQDKTFVKIIITDDGPGIPADIQSRIYDPFFTTKEIGKGTGLGLDVVVRIVKQHKGSIKMNSVPGRTDFTVCFPIDG